MTDLDRFRRPAILFLLALALLVTPAAAGGSHGHNHGRPGPYELPGSSEAPSSFESTVPGAPTVPQDDDAQGEAATGEAEAEAEEKEDEGWKVDEPAEQPSFEVEIDVDQGTWLSLDVSPDGEEIVFDLLGDLYTMPIGGGEATSLTSGMAWDMQPRYSPDGSWIAFTSDRAGGDNIWILPRGGGDPQQVTKESFRLLNSPAWTPDGQFIAARKHFTSTRSLGAGEIWLYHRSGGGGLQMTERPNDQKDLGEPAFSPDGRYLYYSQDATPGRVFEYNKDPNGQIYVVQRLDRETGETEVLLSGPGGAVRPTPSPDGRSLAFVRRVRGDSVLFVRDLASGAEHPVYSRLERDMQETWAVHGVYPTFAWTPDNQALVFWAGGKIHRLDLDAERTAGEVSEIPFRVRDSRRVLEALRSTHEVSPERFPLKMLRWVQVSPDGSQVVYQALGRLWLRPLPDGEPRLLTGRPLGDPAATVESYPAFSRDGRFLVYASWDDEQLGAVRIAPAAPGGESRAVTAEPGQYVEPAFSPDGETVVYRKVGGGFLRSPLHSSDTGVYRIPAAGGEPTLVTDRGFAPHFGADDDRLFLVDFADGQRVLKSVDLDGAEERSHFTSERATEMAVSPDGRWLAFRELFDAYIAPFPATGKPVAIGPGASSIPVAEVSHDAGEYLHWSGDSSTLYWALGPELFSRPLNEAFAFLDGAPEELPGPPEEGRNIAFEAASDRPGGQLALVGGRVITMRGDEVIEQGTVLVDGNRITAVGPVDEVAVPAGATVIDTAGKTVMPGLIDVHWHGSFAEDSIVPQENWMAHASLAFGVTTLHDPSNDTAATFAAAELQRAGLITAPRIYSTGTILYGAEGSFKAVVDSLDDARAHLRRMRAVGAISVKSYNQPRRDQRQQVVAAAREIDMMVVPEGGSLFQHNMTMVVDGHTGIEHSLPVPMVYDDVKQLWGATEVGYTPTLGVGYGGIWGEDYWYAKTDVWADDRLLSFVPRRFIDPRSRRRVTVPEEEWNYHAWKNAHRLLEAGVPVQLGAHGQREGLAVHWELWMFRFGGMSALQAIRASTLDGARYIGLDGDIGSLEPGKLADLLVIDGNPLDDIYDSRNVRYTVLNGRVYDAATMHQVGSHPAPRGRLWFEDEAPPMPGAGGDEADGR